MWTLRALLGLPQMRSPIPLCRGLAACDFPSTAKSLVDAADTAVLRQRTMGGASPTEVFNKSAGASLHVLDVGDLFEYPLQQLELLYKKLLA
jgi:hypothetical protein